MPKEDPEKYYCTRALGWERTLQGERVPSGTPLAVEEDVTQEGKDWQAELFMLYLWHFLCPAYLDPGIEDIQKGQGVSQWAPQASPGCQAVQVTASPAPVQEGRGHAEDSGNGERRGSQVQERPQHQHLPCRGRECMRQQAVPTQAATPPCYERPHQHFPAKSSTMPTPGNSI